jgi:hypothetical protein
MELLRSKIISGSFEEVIYHEITAQEWVIPAREWVHNKIYITNNAKMNSASFRLIKVKERKYDK